MAKYGIFAWFGYRLPIDVRLRLIAEAGFDCVMLWWGDEFVEIDGEKTRHPDLARKYGLEIANAHAPYEHANYLWDDGIKGEAYEKMLLEGIRSCALSGVPVLVVHPSAGKRPELPAGNAGIQRLLRLLDEAGKLGVKLALENVERPDYLDYVFSSIGDENLGFCYDSGHDFLVSGGLGILEKYADRLLALHLHDNDGLEDLHLLPGDGKIDWQAVKFKLNKAGFGGPITLECFACWEGDEGGVERKAPEVYLARALNAIKKIF